MDSPERLSTFKSVVSWRRGSVLECGEFLDGLSRSNHTMSVSSPEAKVGMEFYLVPPKTVVHENGDSTGADVSRSSSRLFLCVLEIADVIEQESLDISICGSADGNDWSTKPILKFPQRFYRGTTQMVLELAERPEVKFIRARWGVNRWGRGSPVPMFEFSLAAREVPRAG